MVQQKASPAFAGAECAGTVLRAVMQPVGAGRLELGAGFLGAGGLVVGVGEHDAGAAGILLVVGMQERRFEDWLEGGDGVGVTAFTCHGGADHAL